MIIRKAAALVLAAALGGCASLPPTTLAVVDGRAVEVVVTRHGTPPVVFENGLGGTLAIWQPVLAALGPEATTFAYHRPGMGRSAPATSPRDGAHIVDELRALLRAQGLAPPYVLVGLSLGGLYMQDYARRYPQEVAALVLVDSTHPRQLEDDGAIEQRSWLTRALLSMLVTGVSEEELRLLPDTGRQVLALPPPAGVPVFVLAAAKPLAERSVAADDANAKRRDIARLYPGAREIWVDSGHVIPLEKPEAIVSVVREILAKR